MAQISRRCSKACHSWPDLESYSICPACGSGTRRFRGLTPLSLAEAESARKHAEFEHYYQTEHIADVEVDLLDSELAGLSSGVVPSA